MTQIEPSAVARQAAKELRGMYLALKAEGFTEREALVIISELIRAQGSGK